MQGIDVSYWNNQINWSKAAKNIDFAMIRAGYGINNIDSRCLYNADQCAKHNIPFGFYWFSYAINEEMARDEANYLCDIADSYCVSLPLAFDFEYDSYNNATSELGYAIGEEYMANLAIAFLEQVKKRGYEPMIYTNCDFFNRGFYRLGRKYKIWLAQWEVDTPMMDCYMWQYSDAEFVDGIKGLVDHDYLYGELIDNNKQGSECKLDVSIVSKGSTGTQVKTIQALLMMKFGISCGDYGCDGIFGNDTDTAVRNFQRKFGLVIDGIVGVNTWNKLVK